MHLQRLGSAIVKVSSGEMNFLILIHLSLVTVLFGAKFPAKMVFAATAGLALFGYREV